MAKVVELKQTMSNPDPKKHSVKYEADERDVKKNRAAFTGVYLMRDACKAVGIKNLDDVEEIEVIVRIKAQGNSKKSEEEDEDEED